MVKQEFSVRPMFKKEFENINIMEFVKKLEAIPDELGVQTLPYHTMINGMIFLQKIWECRGDMITSNI